MKREGIILYGSICLTVLLAILPEFSGAVAPGQTWGRIPNSSPGIDVWYDTFPQSDSRGLWSTVYIFNDKDEDEWISGFTILDIRYRDFTVPDPYVYYVNYMTIPWVAITWDSLERVIYPFDDYGGSMDNKFRFSSAYEYKEGNEDADPENPTSMDAQDNLDCNDDETIDFTIEIWYQLNVDPVSGAGNIDMHIRVVNHPTWRDGNGILRDWCLEGDYVRYMEFPFLFNPDVDGQSNNDVQWWNSSDKWEDVDEERAFATTNGRDCIKVLEGDRNIIMKSVDCGQSYSTWYVIKYDSDGQFSQFPDAYLDSEDMDDEDVEVWYIANFTRDAILQPGFGLISANYRNLTSH